MNSDALIDFPATLFVNNMAYCCHSSSFSVQYYKYHIKNTTIISTISPCLTAGVHEDGTIDLPITFHATEPGHYPCKVILRSQDDVRVYRIECTVTPEGSEATISFTAPTHQAVSQDIPIVSAATFFYIHVFY